MAMGGSSGIEVGQQRAQQGKGVAQGRTGIVGRTVGPQEGGKLAAGMYALLDRQVEQQGRALRKAKVRRLLSCTTFGRAQHSQT